MTTAAIRRFFRRQETRWRPVLWQFVQLVLWCSWSLAGSQAAATGAFHSQHSAHHVTQAANRAAQAACLQTSQFSPGPYGVIRMPRTLIDLFSLYLYHVCHFIVDFKCSYALDHIATLFRSPMYAFHFRLAVRAM